MAPSKQESTTYEPSPVCKLLILGCRLLIPDRLLGIRFAIETIPPFLMGGTRFVLAGAILWALELARGHGEFRLEHFRSTLIIGALLIVGGNGAVVWAEQFIPSGLTALLIATEPLWIVILLWSRGRERVRTSEAAGLAMGFAGILFLVGPAEIAGGERIDPAAALVVVLGTVSWALGSLYSRKAPQPRSQILSTGMSMLMGGMLMLSLAAVRGEFSALDVSAVSMKSALAFAYLVLFPSLLAFTSYLWLLRNTTPAKASTYAYVNPVVAVAIGWWLGGEALNARVLIAASIIISAVWFIVGRSRHGEAQSGG